MPARTKKSNTYLLILSVIVIIGLITVICIISYPSKSHNKILNSDLQKIKSDLKELKSKPNSDIYDIESNPSESNSLVINNIYSNRKSPIEGHAYERVFNPLLYPYKSPPLYNHNHAHISHSHSHKIPPHVVGCGSRRTPCMGNNQVAITNTMPSLIIDDSSISPINISTQGPIGEPQQVGAIYKVFGNENHVYPLFGRRKFPNDNKWEYYTTIGQYGVKMPVVTPRKNDELGTNETVFIKGQKTPYRVSIYETDHPQYIPYA